MAETGRAKKLIAKIATLPAEQVTQAEAFVDFLLEREQVRGFAAASAGAFAAVWDNPEDAAYDDL